MGDDYASIYLNSPFSQQDPLGFLLLIMLFLGRILPIIGQAPFFGAKVLPGSVKIALGLSLFAIMLPELLAVTTTPLRFNMDIIILFLKELFIGIILGYLISLPFIIAQNTGVLIDHQRGASSLMVNDPTTQSQTSPLGTLFNFVLIYLFFMIDGPFNVIDAIARSYEMLPPDKLLSEEFFKADSKFYIESIKVMGHVMILSTQLAAPALIMILMTDFFLGIANRLAPQVQITFLGMPLKSLLAIVVVFFGWTLFNKQLLIETNKWVQYFSLLIDTLQPAT